MFELNKSNIIKILGIITFAILLFLGVQNIGAVGNVLGFLFKLLAPFVIGFCIAFILNVPLTVLEKRVWAPKKTKKAKKNSKWKRPVGIGISIVIFVAVLFFVLFLVIPELITTFDTFKENIPDVVKTVQGWLEKMTVNYPDINESIKNVQFNWDMINENLLKFVQTGVSNILTSSINFIMSFITGIVNFVIGIIFAVYLLMRKEKLLVQLKKVLYAYLPKEKVDKLIHIGEVSNKVFNNFVTGQFTEAVILGVLCFVGMLILQIPFALTISVLIGFTALIPMVGAFIGIAIGVVLIIVKSPILALVFVVFILILQQIEGNIIYPRVVGKSVGLPAMWVMFAITIGGSMMGLIGMVISVPISSVLYVLLAESVGSKLKKKEIVIE